jgi:DNA-binding LacI/PurR family transcriptional regulator
MNVSDKLRLAAEANVNPRTVDRFLDGLPMRLSTRQRVADALKKLRLAKPEATPPNAGG